MERVVCGDFRYRVLSHSSNYDQTTIIWGGGGGGWPNLASITEVV